MPVPFCFFVFPFCFSLAQRLVRRVCQACRDNATKGCDACRNTGYRGRLGIYELLVVDEAMRGFITRRSHSSELRDYAVAHGMRLLSDSGQAKIDEGLTTLEEVQRVTMRASM